MAERIALGLLGFDGRVEGALEAVHLRIQNGGIIRRHVVVVPL